jgi:hypothetical protein
MLLSILCVLLYLVASYFVGNCSLKDDLRERIMNTLYGAITVFVFSLLTVCLYVLIHSFLLEFKII